MGKPRDRGAGFGDAAGAGLCARGTHLPGFLASYVNGKSQSWLQGAACKPAPGQWEIHTLKPWQANAERSWE